MKINIGNIIRVAYNLLFVIKQSIEIINPASTEKKSKELENLREKYIDNDKSDYLYGRDK